jgi:hypothetical protein
LELEVPISGGHNYDVAVARELGGQYQPLAPPAAAAAGEGVPTLMRTQRLASSLVPNKTHYAVGVCKDGAGSVSVRLGVSRALMCACARAIAL